MVIQQQIELFLAGSPHAVAGASADRRKYGNKVLRAYLQNNRRAYPVNPTAGVIESLESYATLADLPEPMYGISIITPPAITERLVEDALELGVQHIWMQPGSESELAVKQAREGGANIIANGPCLLVALRFREA